MYSHIVYVCAQDKSLQCYLAEEPFCRVLPYGIVNHCLLRGVQLSLFAWLIVLDCPHAYQSLKCTVNICSIRITN